MLNCYWNGWWVGWLILLKDCLWLLEHLQSCSGKKNLTWQVLPSHHYSDISAAQTHSPTAWHGDQDSVGLGRWSESWWWQRAGHKKQRYTTWATWLPENVVRSFFWDRRSIQCGYWWTSWCTEGLKRLFLEFNERRDWCAVGSVYLSGRLVVDEK